MSELKPSEVPLKDKQWDPDDYYIIPGQRFLELRERALKTSRMHKEIHQYRKQIEEDLLEAVRQVDRGAVTASPSDCALSASLSDCALSLSASDSLVSLSDCTCCYDEIKGAQDQQLFACSIL